MKEGLAPGPDPTLKNASNNNNSINGQFKSKCNVNMTSSLPDCMSNNQHKFETSPQIKYEPNAQIKYETNSNVKYEPI